MIHQLKKIVYNQRWVLFSLSLFGFIFHFIFTAVLSTAEIRTLANGFFQLIPPAFRSLAGFGDAASLLGSRLIAFGYSHPACLLMLIFIPVSTASRYVTGEVENKTIDILLIRLYPRWRIPVSAMVYSVVSLAVVFFWMAMGTLTGRLMFGLQDEFSMVSVYRILGIGMLFYGTITAFVIYIATLNRERGKTMSWSAGMLLTLYVLDVISKIWDKAHFLDTFSFFDLYRTGDISDGTYGFTGAILVLLILIAVFSAAAVVSFEKKDL